MQQQALAREALRSWQPLGCADMALVTSRCTPSGLRGWEGGSRGIGAVFRASKGYDSSIWCEVVECTLEAERHTALKEQREADDRLMIQAPCG